MDHPIQGPNTKINRRATLKWMGAATAASVASRALAQTEVGHVTNIAGTGYAGDAPQRPLSPEASLLLGDTVWTEAASHAALALDLGAVVYLGPETQLMLDRFVAASHGVMTLGYGAMVFDRDDGLPDIDLEVRSSFAQIALRGTRFFVGPSRAAFAVFVERGSLSVTAGGAQVILQAGDGVSVEAPGAPLSAVTQWKPPRIAEAFAQVLP
jgi:ferric-dicitrate binding protein FerR (iron transport regulator)